MGSVRVLATLRNYVSRMRVYRQRRQRQACVQRSECYSEALPTPTPPPQSHPHPHPTRTHALKHLQQAPQLVVTNAAAAAAVTVPVVRIPPCIRKTVSVWFAVSLQSIATKRKIAN